MHSGYAFRMAVTITIRNVPDETRDALAARAAASGRSLQEYLSAELRELAERPDVATAVAQIRARVHARRLPDVDTADILRDIEADRR
jgi:plasmid stability protein